MSYHEIEKAYFDILLLKKEPEIAHQIESFMIHHKHIISKTLFIDFKEVDTLMPCSVAKLVLLGTMFNQPYELFLGNMNKKVRHIFERNGIANRFHISEGNKFVYHHKTIEVLI